MTPKNITQVRSWFDVLETTRHSQVAMMTLHPGDESGAVPEDHPHSDQVLLLIEGSLKGTIGEDSITLHAHDFVTIPAGTKHRFWNEESRKAVTFNVYAAPAYPAGTAE